MLHLAQEIIVFDPTRGAIYRMHLKVLACNVLTREVSWCAARCPHTLDIVYLPKAEHNAPTRLRAMLQEQIDLAAASDTKYDAVVLVYGICGNATIGLEARTCPLVIPRAHDCTTLFLGSKEKFQEHFGANPSQAWTSLGYSERGDTLVSEGNARIFGEGNVSYAELVETYGEENARYIVDAMSASHESKDIPFLDVPETHVPELVACLFKRIAESGKNVTTIPGSIGIVENLIGGNWPEERFLVVPPGHRIEGLYDYEKVMTVTQTC